MTFNPTARLQVTREKIENKLSAFLRERERGMNLQSNLNSREVC